MLCYSEVPDAVSAARRIITATQADAPPAIHASVHTGSAILREGDYFGGAVNIAARMLDSSEGNELIASRPVVESCGDEFDWQSAGTIRIRGVTEPVEVFKLTL
jgi:class 3 adenylate cyclase